MKWTLLYLIVFLASPVLAESRLCVGDSFASVTYYENDGSPKSADHGRYSTAMKFLHADSKWKRIGSDNWVELTCDGHFCEHENGFGGFVLFSPGKKHFRYVFNLIGEREAELVTLQGSCTTIDL